MSEKSASCGEQGIDRLLAEAGLDEAYEIRTELLELRALANNRPQPSAAVQALMAPALMAPARGIAASAGGAAAPIDELVARRRKKSRMAFAAVAVAASLAAGATAAAASDGGIPGTIEHLGAVVGSFVSQLTTGSGGNAPQQQGTRSEPMPTRETSVPAKSTPVPTSPDAPSSTAHPTPRATPSAGSLSDPREGLRDIAKGGPESVTIPTPAITGPTLPLPEPVPSEILPGNPVKP
ncbi:hypothetical protein [Arthrobacter sp. MMS18-M83]|uniref:hypothetical protein n=1 Tax=Arthrobacter sp. MMS18-M83 TaxID=2996261 RepID=UPI00227B4B02|nr:hypothetical protein [Arthrobacter sp. MMS18-M83]WAH95344.1 hypothetical protein OW521_12825 [Arthrobacter sp. MMS18-M83]